jgi:preprotein translocase subunit SecB
MSDTDTGNGQTGADGTEPAERPPQISINAQYVKDLSFENPGAPESLMQRDGQPNIQVNIDVQARGIAEDSYETVLRIVATAQQNDETVFMVELVYGGIFTLQNIPRENHELVCLVECPRLIFPFARRIVSDAVRDGGFPPLLLEPIDFVELYRRHRRPPPVGEDAVQDSVA